MTTQAQFQYPTVRRDENFAETLHGKEIKDPYRWLEDPDAEETKAFVRDQNKLFFSFIEKYPHREQFKQKLTTLYDYERFGCPFKRGDSYYYFHNSGLQPQSVLYKQSSLTAEPKTFLDPNKLSDDGTVAISTYSFTKSGKFFAYALSASGSDWVTIHVRETRDDAPLEFESQPIQWAKFTGVSWTHDDKGFFYNRYPKPDSVEREGAGTETDSNKNAQLCYHLIGTPQEEDVVVWSDPSNPEHMFSAEVSEDGKYVILSTAKDCDPVNKVFIVDLEKEFAKTNGEGFAGKPDVLKIVDNFDAEYNYLTNEGTRFWFQTTLNAPKRRVVSYDLNEPEKGFVEVIPESEDVLSHVSVVDDNKLVLIYLHDVKDVIRLHSLHTGAPLTPSELPLPLGSIVGSMSGRKEDKELFYSFSSFTTPGMIYRFDFATMTHSVFRQTKVNGLKADILQTQQVFYTSKDGTRVPMYIISRKDTKLDGNNPTMLYGYGGFNHSVTPTFAVTWLTFIQHMKGIVAVANIRGGGEYGEEKWYKEGKLTKKQNVFDDFQWAAKHLIAEKYTSPAKLAINGGSNGGLLVGACLNQAPELFAAGVAEVGVMDMLRFHKFTIGHAWTSDYGNPDVKEDFEVVLKYSPLHNIRSDKPYPAVLVLTGDHDDRVVPLHSLKYLATLQHVARNNPRPLMGRVETKAGHGAGKSTKQRIEEATDKFAFLGLALGTEWDD
ncbi:hypothetical protein HK104_000871 [Borealophlyctis nickersoniae]|nr:hypothetical protein HK104_000871 [Borealophlyctis nickersoniae]